MYGTICTGHLLVTTESSSTSDEVNLAYNLFLDKQIKWLFLAVIAALYQQQQWRRGYPSSGTR